MPHGGLELLGPVLLDLILPYELWTRGDRCCKLNYLRLDIIQTALFGSQWSDYILLNFIYTLRGSALMDLESEEVA